MSLPLTAAAQELLDEITVSARKREESLVEVPVSISVIGASFIKDAGILSQQDLFDLTPGIHYDEQLDRNSASPSVRGVQSNEIATNRTKVTQFIDGMPVLGSQGNIQFNSVQQVEVYRGPQSAAFGRSTFGGAVNYVTKDPGEEIDASVYVDFDDYGKQRFGGSVSGPISDKVGFLVDVNIEDSDAPNKFVATDGIDYGQRASDSYAAKLVFNPTDKIEAELTFSHVESDDSSTVGYYISQSARDACFDGTTYSNMGVNLWAKGTFNCNWSQGTQIASQHDRRAVLEAMGETNDDILFLAESQSIPFGLVGAEDERDRLSLQLDFQMDDGSLIQVSAFSGDENYIRNGTGGNSGEGPNGGGIIFAPGMAGPPGSPPPPAYVLVDMGPGAVVGTIMSDPSNIDETYFEARWVSPAENRLRYVVGASYYDYDFVTNLYFGGYGAVLQGQAAIDRYLALTNINVSVPTQVFQESATNTGVFFNLTYDATDKLALSLEGRYQSDDAGGVDTVSGEGGSVDTKAFLPRASFTYKISDSSNFYGQISKGNNPGGVNVGFFNPNIIANLDGPGQAYVTYDSDTFKYFKEETLLNYELGFKGTLFDDRLSYATAIYMMDWQDQAQSVNLSWDDPAAPPGPPAPFTGNRTFVNEGDLKMSGIEFEGTFRVSDSFNVRFTASYLNAEYDDYCDTTLLGTGLDVDPGRVRTATASRPYNCYDVSGLEVAQQPSFNASFSPSYRAPLGSAGLQWNARADIRYKGVEYLESANSAELDSVTTINASTGISGERWDATLYVNNLTDNDTPVRINGGTDYSITTDTLGLGANFQRNYLITPRQERTAGLRASFRF